MDSIDYIDSMRYIIKIAGTNLNNLFYDASICPCFGAMWSLAFELVDLMYRGPSAA